MTTTIRNKCPYLKKMWRYHGDVETFNKFARTLMRFGIVNSMVMDIQCDRYYYNPDDASDIYSDYAYEEYEHVCVGVMVDGKEEVYEIYEEWY